MSDQKVTPRVQSSSGSGDSRGFNVEKFRSEVTSVIVDANIIRRNVYEVLTVQDQDDSDAYGLEIGESFLRLRFKEGFQIIQVQSADSTLCEVDKEETWGKTKTPGAEIHSGGIGLTACIAHKSAFNVYKDSLTSRFVDAPCQFAAGDAHVGVEWLACPLSEPYFLHNTSTFLGAMVAEKALYRANTFKIECRDNCLYGSASQWFLPFNDFGLGALRSILNLGLIVTTRLRDGPMVWDDSPDELRGMLIKRFLVEQKESKKGDAFEFYLLDKVAQPLVVEKDVIINADLASRTRERLEKVASMGLAGLSRTHDSFLQNLNFDEAVTMDFSS